MAILAVPVFIAILMIPSMLGLTAAWITYDWLAIVVCGGVGLHYVSLRFAARD